MGTFGESLSLRWNPLPFLGLALEGGQERLLAAEQEFELYGSAVKGNSSRDVLRGAARLSGDFSLAGLGLSPWAAFELEQASTYSIVRIVESGSGIPEDSAGFMDLRGRESLLGPVVGLDLAFALPGGFLDLDAQAYLGPLASLSIQLDRFRSLAGWPASGSATTMPFYFWSRRSEDLKVKSSYYGGSLALDLRLRRPDLRLGLRAQGRRMGYAGLSDALVQNDIPYKDYVAFPAGDGPLEMISSTDSLTAFTSLDFLSLEAGIELGFGFLKTALGLRSEPSLGLSWAALVRSFSYDYSSEEAGLSAERWTERYGFVRFSATLGI
jgi:hypothetical protein